MHKNDKFDKFQSFALFLPIGSDIYLVSYGIQRATLTIVNQDEQANNIIQNYTFSISWGITKI